MAPLVWTYIFDVNMKFHREMAVFYCSCLEECSSSRLAGYLIDRVAGSLLVTPPIRNREIPLD